MYDEFGRRTYTTKEVMQLLYTGHEDVGGLTVIDTEEVDKFNEAINTLYLSNEPLLHQEPNDITMEEFDKRNQAVWYMPEEYQELDIAKWCLDKCVNDEQLQRVGEELILYQDRGLFPILQFLVYMVDTFRENNIVWGVGRGSSVASYILFLIGVHKIDSIYYNLKVDEFLR